MMSKYDTIGANYNSTRKADNQLTGKILHFLKAKKDKLYFDIGCGTGNYTLALADKGLNFVGIKPSRVVLEIAQSRSQKVKWLVGTAEQIVIKKGHR